MNLQQRINKLPQLSSSFSFGKDIDNIHSFIFNETSKDKIEDLIRKWAEMLFLLMKLHLFMKKKGYLI